MRINGREIAQKILDNLKQKVARLKKNGIIPHLYIITLTTDAASNAYVSQKKLKGTEIGAEITVENLDPKTTTPQLLQKIKLLNKDPKIHGIIVQRPMPSQISEVEIANSIDPTKDVDGFHPNSDFIPPVALAVLRILEQVFKIKSQIQNSKFQINSKGQNTNDQNVLNFDNSNLDIILDLDIENSNFFDWLRDQSITVIGRGVTAGKPIIKTFEKTRSDLAVVTSKTKNREKIMKNSDIIIAAVGKPNIIKGENLKNGVILIGVGMFQGEDGKFHSDYEEDDIKNIVSFYTPTPGGVGPVNVAMLLSNLIKATENKY